MLHELPGGHEVEQQDAQRADILGDRTVGGHDEYILTAQFGGSG